MLKKTNKVSRIPILYPSTEHTLDAPLALHIIVDKYQVNFLFLLVYKTTSVKGIKIYVARNLTNVQLIIKYITNNLKIILIIIAMYGIRSHIIRNSGKEEVIS